MKTLSRLILASSLALAAGSAYAAPDAAMQGDNSAINSACAADAKTAGCGDKVVGKGLLKCIHAYKKANKGFKLSDACKDAMKERRADRKAGK